MTKHRNAILILVSLVLFIYAGFISIYPAFLSKTFNKNAFEKKAEEATGLKTHLDSIEFKIKPNMDMVITIGNWSSKYVDDQDCFAAGRIDITTNPGSIITKNFKIKELDLNNVKYSNQVFENGQNKLAYLPGSFNPKPFGASKVTIAAGPVKAKNFTIVNIGPNYYREDKRSISKYSRADVRSFLSSQKFKNVNIK
ncbi:hypothetical protein IJ182_03655 [bacterium]|nr:hypothetical protein [bacterium]